MATNKYFNNYNARYTDQRLMENLIVESIKIMGVDVYYLPNDNDLSRDLLYGEDPVKKFPAAFTIEAYPNNVADYGGEKDFFSKFGLEIRNDISVIISKRSFEERVQVSGLYRPREGDLIFVPVLNGVGELYEIKFADQDKDMSLLGRPKPYYWELSLEKFKYSNEQITTGVPEIDLVVTDSAYTIHFDTGVGSGNYLPSEIVFQSTDGTTNNCIAYATVQQWLPLSNTLSVTNIAGEFVDGYEMIGYQTGANYILNSYDPMYHPAAKESYDNYTIRNESLQILDFSETNPFGPI